MADTTIASISFTAEEQSEINGWYNDGLAAGNFSEMYTNISSLLQAKLAEATPSDQELIKLV